MKDQTLDSESRAELKGDLARLAKRNSSLSIIGVVIAIGLMIYLKALNINDPVDYSIVMSLGLLINSLAIMVSSFQSSREMYSFRVPLMETLVPILSSFLIGLVFILYPFAPIHGQRLVQDLFIMAYRAAIALAVFATINLLLNQYSRDILRRSFAIITKR
ncbi:hypothetical protein [Metallosphaera hakonensis]|nr:hypothetical protein [Metallosphaera hakonensis]